ncbi:wall-associated receptor kinase-like 1 [Punica granatum]|uniref:Wall-associated receptor kinase-like 1 n=3 Tax=Punica granatum TaxID=22663 RepID=A0A6P8CNL4_PUNGR|nr:wall-associated receptor kinase-like 1 [Punica granatum]
MIPKLMFQILLLLGSIKAQGQAATDQLAKTGCQQKCGNVTIPFPFGIGPAGCFLDDWYEVACPNGTNTPRLKKLELQVLNITLPFYYGPGGDAMITVNFPVIYSRDCSRNQTRESVMLEGSSFVIAQDRNIFAAVGCSRVALIENTKSAVVGCKLSECSSRADGTSIRPNSDCSGLGCCQTTTTFGLQSFNVSFRKDEAASGAVEGCSYAALVDRAEFSPSRMHALEQEGYVPAVLQWGVANTTHFGINLLHDSRRGYGHYYCSSRSMSDSYIVMPFMQCFCYPGYDGNPYLGNGCQDVNECEDHDILKNCHGKCVNTKGYYKCVDGSRAVKLAMMVIGGFIGALLFLLSMRWLRRAIRRRKKMKLKQKFFKQNGGLLLQQQLSSPEGNVEKSKLFDSKKLERATDNFNENRILGQGGQGTVYKGMLMDGKIVAIKKSKVLDEGNVEQFINEVFILSQINHRNVVKLLGCCLETEVPLLVYEFIPNGTLYQYLHDPNEEFPVPWDVRLRIATEVAGALSYLHSAASIPIYHRDIKSTNILLDEKYRAKIADFGTSRSVALDQTHVTTLVQGTFGYLDPEYFQSSQFTDKSDVYSFGVVLVELVTGQKPISSLRAQEGRSLATYFIISMEEDRLFDILDPQVLNEGKKDEIITVAHLAMRCLNLNGRKRPTMKEVAMELEAIKRPSHPSDEQQINRERQATFEIDGVEAHDVAFRSAEFEAGDGISSMTDVYPLLSSDTW